MSTLPPLRQLLRERRTLIAAHRGASAYAPENTLAAYRLAVEMGVEAIEVDVHLSRDGVPVVIHDPRLDRTTNAEGLVKDHSAAQLKQLDVGSWFDTKFSSERLPTLEELLLWAKGRTNLLIEIKNNPYKYGDIHRRVAELVQRHRMSAHVEIFSFDHTVAREAKAVDPSLLTGVCYAADPVSHSALATHANADVIHPNYNFCTPEAVEDAHSHGIFVTTWTVNAAEDARRLIDAGVDCIKTDHPDILIETV